jgi:quinol monooxygenase YgiN
MPELQAIARYTVTAGNEDAVIALIEELANASRTEPGNISFDAYRKTDDPSNIVLLERYASRDAFAAHRATPHFKRLVLEQIVPLLQDRVIDEFDAS